MIARASHLPGVTLGMACAWFGIRRQAYYQACYQQQQRAAQEQLILELVRGLRQRHPRMGGRKLLHELHAPLRALGIQRGRDALFALLRAHDLLVPSKRSGRRTTWGGGVHYPNLLSQVRLTHVHQVWVGDITYLSTEGSFVYLALLTDAYSRFIVGYDLSATLALDGAARALEQALAATPTAALRGLIHHSDHGVQYSAYAYSERLRALGIRPSMGQVGTCYDNALAERVNGILKLEYALDSLFVDEAHARRTVQQAIYLYNYERPHLALGYAKPVEVHLAADSPAVPL